MERECRFVDPDDMPMTQKIVIHSTIKKNREGLVGRSHRFFAVSMYRENSILYKSACVKVCPVG